MSEASYIMQQSNWRLTRFALRRRLTWALVIIMSIKKFRTVTFIAMFAFSGAVFALTVAPSEHVPREAITACINYEDSQSTLTKDSVKVISNIVELMNRVPYEYDFHILYRYHPFHHQPYNPVTPNPLFLKLGFERIQTFFDTFRIHNKAASALEGASLSVELKNTIIDFSEPCEASIRIVYPENAGGDGRFLCDAKSKTRSCPPVKCNVDGCNY